MIVLSISLIEKHFRSLRARVDPLRSAFIFLPEASLCWSNSVRLSSLTSSSVVSDELFWNVPTSALRFLSEDPCSSAALSCCYITCRNPAGLHNKENWHSLKDMCSVAVTLRDSYRYILYSPRLLPEVDAFLALPSNVSRRFSPRTSTNAAKPNTLSLELLRTVPMRPSMPIFAPSSAAAVRLCLSLACWTASHQYLSLKSERSNIGRGFTTKIRFNLC